MVRYVWIGTMLASLCIVLYIPSASPPERFTDVLRAEHVVTREIWGPAVADRILRRMLDIQQGSPPLSEPPSPMVHVGQQPAVDTAMAAQMTQMSMRLFGNPYFRSIDSLFALATYRLSAITAYLAAVVLRGIVARGHHHACWIVLCRPVEQGTRAQPDIDDIDALFRQPLHEGCLQRDAALAHIVTDKHCRCLEHGRDRSADAFHDAFIEVRAVHAAHIVCVEDLAFRRVTAHRVVLFLALVVFIARVGVVRP